jgi:O-antigen/teichoic acid export membrane protein
MLLVGRADVRAWTSAVATLTRTAGIVVAVQLDSPEAVLVAYMLGSLTGATLQGLFAWRLGWREWVKAPPSGHARDWLRPLAHFGVHTSITTSLLSSERSLVLVFLGALVGPAATGLFNIALLPLTVVATVSGPIRLVLFAEQAKLAASNQIATLRRSVRGSTIVALLLGVPFAVGGWFLLPWLIPTLFSDRFDDAVEPARIILIGAVAHLAAGSWDKGLPAAIGKPQLRSLMSGVFMVSVVTLTVLLAPPYGVTGAAIAHSAAAISTYVVWWFLTQRVLRKLDSPATTVLESDAPVLRPPVDVKATSGLRDPGRSVAQD